MAAFSLFAKITCTPLIIWILPVWSGFRHGERSVSRWTFWVCECFRCRCGWGNLTLWGVIIPQLAIGLFFHHPEFSVLFPLPTTLRPFAVGMSVPPPLTAPFFSRPVTVVLGILVTVTIPGVVDSAFPMITRLPVPVWASMRRAVSVSARIVVILIVPSVPMAITITLLTPIPVVSFHVPPPFRWLVLFPVSGRLSFTASRTGVGLVRFLTVWTPFSSCWLATGL